jgi:hypothetical protein
MIMILPGRSLLPAVVLLAASAAASAEPNTIGSLRFLGAASLANDMQVDGTLVGGLSGLDYDPASGRWAMISDDKSDKAPARFYFGRIELAAGAPKVTLDHAVVLQQADGKPYPSAKDPSVKNGGEVPDPESASIPRARRCGGAPSPIASSASQPSCAKPGSTGSSWRMSPCRRCLHWARMRSTDRATIWASRA